MEINIQTQKRIPLHQEAFRFSESRCQNGAAAGLRYMIHMEFRERFAHKLKNWDERSQQAGSFVSGGDENCHIYFKKMFYIGYRGRMNGGSINKKDKSSSILQVQAVLILSSSACLMGACQNFFALSK